MAEEPTDAELCAGYDSHQLAKSVNQMCDEADIPDVMNFVVAPTKPMAILLSNLMRPGVHVVHEIDGEPQQFAEYDSAGNYFATYEPDDIAWDETLDLRLDGELE